MEAQPQGPAFQEEMQYRNTTQEKSGIRSVWEQVQQAAVCNELEVAGRFYATPQLMEVVNLALFQAEMEKGAIVDAPHYLNDRMHDAAVRHVGKQVNRQGTVGSAVSRDVDLSKLGDDIREES